jgi:hypothetical protein
MLTERRKIEPVHWVPGLAQPARALKHFCEAATDDDRRVVITRFQAGRDSLVLVDLLSSCASSAPKQGLPDAGPVKTGPRT